MAKITKEELIKENAKLEQIVSGYKNADEEVRVELSKLLGAEYVQDVNRFHNAELNVYSWMEIAAGIGELMGADKFIKLETKLEEMQERETESFLTITEKFKQLENSNEK